jgi:hypothetical protein
MDGRSLAWFAAGAASAGLLSALLLYRRSPAAQHRSAPAEPPPAEQRAPGRAAGLQGYLQDDVLSEQFTRNIQFFGTAGQDKIINAFVVVVGLGVSRPRRPARARHAWRPITSAPPPPPPAPRERPRPGRNPAPPPAL